MAKEVASMVVEELQAELEPFRLPETCTSAICSSRNLVTCAAITAKLCMAGIQEGLHETDSPPECLYLFLLT